MAEGRRTGAFVGALGAAGCQAEGDEAEAGYEESLCSWSAAPTALSEVKLQGLVGEMLPLQKT